MAPTYADHPFSLIPSPAYSNKQAGTKTDLFDHCASLMATVHNLIVRGLNALYLQAPNVAPADEPYFLNFAGVWYELLHAHHLCEEQHFFRKVDAMAGEKDTMEANVEQHDAFRGQLEEFGAYIDACVTGKAKYDGKKLLAIVDSFGPALMRHLADEIPSIQELRKYGVEKMATLEKALNEDGQQAMKMLGLKKLTIVLSMLDIHYEDDMHADFPPMPAIVNFITRYVLWWFVRSTTKFGASDRHGNRKPLYAVPA